MHEECIGYEDAEIIVALLLEKDLFRQRPTDESMGL
jgi:hypothetical protein